MPYYISIIIQALCIYHVYKTRGASYWYFIIILVPGIGCLIYGITQLVTRNNIEAAQSDIIATINPSKKIKDLQKKVAFSDTFQNRLDLADVLLEQHQYESAEKEYRDLLTNHYKDDSYGNSQLLKAFYGQKKYNEAIEIAEVLKTQKEFEKSRVQFLYGLSLSQIGDHQKAEAILKKIDQRYSHYTERLELAKFYLENDKKDNAIEILTEMQGEFVNLTKPNKRKHKTTFNEVNQLMKKL